MLSEAKWRFSDRLQFHIMASMITKLETQLGWEIGCCFVEEQTQAEVLAFGWSAFGGL